METGIMKVLQRIDYIERKFAPPTQEAAAQSFAGQLSVADAKLSSASIGSADIASLIDNAAQKYAVDPKLVHAVAKVESDYRPTAVSEAGAEGVMQLMPDTAAYLGVADSFDPRQNIEGGTRYLSELLDTFGGDVNKALAAYNAGPQAVKNYNGVPPYAETRNYVQKVLDIYR